MKQLLNIRILKKLILGFFLGLYVTLPLGNHTLANNDLLNQAYDEAKRYDYVVNPGNDKNAVGAQVFNPSIEANANLGQGCFVNGNRLTNEDLKRQYCEEELGFDRDVQAYSHGGAGLGQGCFEKPAQGDYINHDIKDNDIQNYCQSKLGGDRDIQAFEKKEPYLIRLTKLILRITIAISVSIIIFAGISYILAFGDAGKQKKATNIIIYALGGIFIGLSSLAIVELALSITKSSLKF